MVAANAQIGVARAARFPAVSLTAFLGGAERRAVEDIASSGIWGLGARHRLAPLFDAGRREARSRTRPTARYQQTLASGSARWKARSAKCPTRSSTSRRPAPPKPSCARASQAARNALELSRIRYESGYSPYLEVLDAQRTANDAEIAFVRNRQARLAFSVDLMRALGRRLEPNRKNSGTDDPLLPDAERFS